MSHRYVHELRIEERNKELESLKQQLTTWVNGLAPWKEFFTGTFAGEFSERSACSAFERFMRKHAPDVSYFYVSEANPSREGHHIHALLCDTIGLSYANLGKKWFKTYGINKLERIRSVDDVGSYCAKHAGKYLTKGNGWYNINLVDPELWRRAHCG